jgi:glutamine cyclotransferase
MRFLTMVAALTLLGCDTATPAKIPEYTYEIVHTYPHDPEAFTEGLLFLNGFLYESTGIAGSSTIRKVRLETGEILQQRALAEAYFGEGIVNWHDTLVQLTWRSQVGFMYDLGTFAPKGQFSYSGEGWALTQDGKRIIMDDGTPQIRFLDPETLRETGHITVTADGRPLNHLNELEWVKGELYANVWQTDRIARIDPSTGRVVGWIDCTGLLSPSDRATRTVDVLNGIAYDPKADRLFITGKYWPKLFEIKLLNKRAD